MLKFLIIPLAKNSVSFCAYDSESDDTATISEDTLKKTITWAMKQNVMPQFVYPANTVPSNIIALTKEIDHVAIVPSTAVDADLLDNADVIVFNNWADTEHFNYKPGQIYVVRTTLDDLLGHNDALASMLTKADRINVTIIDQDKFSDSKTQDYQSFLEGLIPAIANEFKNGHQVQLNLLTDRLMYDKMNNCNAGDESIALSTDGKFYACPAFIGDDMDCLGSIDKGLDLKNPQLYKISHAPICRVCDAWQCKRCVWLNKRLTREVNTPSHQQCVISHIERIASKKLQKALQKINPTFLADVVIPELDYLDPFDKIVKKHK